MRGEDAFPDRGKVPEGRSLRRERRIRIRRLGDVSRETSVATFQVAYWQEIPSQVDAREGGAGHKEILSQRFQDLIDIVATARRMNAADDYMGA